MLGRTIAPVMVLVASYCTQAVTTCSALAAAAPPQQAVKAIVRLEATRCGTTNGTHALSGFVMKRGQQVGILTSLHGVAGCRFISARSQTIHVSSLHIVDVDVARDAAWLVSPLLKAETASVEPLESSSSVTDDLWLVGFPLGVEYPQVTRLEPQYVPRPVLADLLPMGSDERVTLAQRNSPTLGSRVLSTRGVMAPGHSGGAVLNAAGQVVAVACGGLRGGAYGVNWSIPLADIAWSPSVLRQQELARLAVASVANAIFQVQIPSPRDRDSVDLRANILSALQAKRRDAARCSTVLECEHLRRATENLEASWESLTRILEGVHDALAPGQWNQSPWQLADGPNAALLLDHDTQTLQRAAFMMYQAKEICRGIGVEGFDTAVASAHYQMRDAFASSVGFECSTVREPPLVGAYEYCVPRDAIRRRAAARAARQAMEDILARLRRMD